MNKIHGKIKILSDFKFQHTFTYWVLNFEYIRINYTYVDILLYSHIYIIVIVFNLNYFILLILFFVIIFF